MTIKYDRDVDVLYIRLTDKEIVESAESQSGNIVDLDENGEVVGVEVLGFERRNDPFNISIPQGKSPVDIREMVLAG